MAQLSQDAPGTELSPPHPHPPLYQEQGLAKPQQDGRCSPHVYRQEMGLREVKSWSESEGDPSPGS